MTKRISKVQKVWAKVEAELQAYPLDSQREFFAAAAKFLIDPSHWNDLHPVTPYDGRPEIESFHAGFVQYSAGQMSGLRSATVTDSEKAVLLLLKRAVGWRGHKIDRIVAIGKLRTFRHRMLKRFSDLRDSDEFYLLEAPGRKLKTLKGLRVYEVIIRDKYLREVDRKTPTNLDPSAGDAGPPHGDRPQTNAP